MGINSTESLIHMDLEEIRNLSASESERVAKLGEWPAYQMPHAKESIAGRIPQEGVKDAAGFDAGVACSLGLIPPEKQRLAAILHGNYSPKAVEQVRQELKAMDPDSETTWWLAACDICAEGGVDENKFREQLKSFEDLSADPKARVQAAKSGYEKMASTFTTEKYDFPFGTADGCIQGAYLAGHLAGASYSPEYGLYFIGTYLPTLGLEDFQWSDEKDEKGRPKSGGVHGSKQFVKCVNEAEFLRAIAVVKQRLAMDKKKV